ncbi:nickel-type superoxide dismutase maturation protease [Streptomyces sp. H10-C2]|uniref:nickel-type superoxide dismutase maturation protease n=1 Tax=unclassified Streptomyces TaxID=2593676 RepID=UPI0024B87CF4|nr:MULTISPECIES: nickel-type superoxide dismutase maturation protease [unclassified Streptomyces]MDJ0343267.1 nickel-type superoxide dismutase maturation protease [Streptomyces sp. PH10-H1]MDJ0370600.1 nickel-type superoxide dismutase maturation protease [Streptomyces sp. H10-C2]
MREQGVRLPYTVEVTGVSMVPTLYEGDRLFVRYVKCPADVREGDVVVLRHPLQQDLLIVKRAVERREGGWWVLADNPFGPIADSSVFGTVPDELMLARALARFRPPREVQRSVAGALSWAASCVRPMTADRSFSRRLRAR